MCSATTALISRSTSSGRARKSAPPWVPEPVGFCTDPTVVGAPFALMGLVEGVGLGPRIAKDVSLGGDRERLAEDLGRDEAVIEEEALDEELAEDILGAEEEVDLGDGPERDVPGDFDEEL